ncbi:MAG: hypothetical protein MUE81_12800, partial [Thermoflexibacter sp.]|nr:hypothetical protein [Thermoflexibacter sp.]
KKVQKTIGIIGESKYDDEAVVNLFSKQYPHFHFKPLLANALVRGAHLYSPKFERMIKSELQSFDYRIVIFSIDLDDLETVGTKIRQKQEWFAKFDSLGKNLLLLHIFEMEALILADIATFNQIFKTQIKFVADPMRKEKPKEFLETKTRKNTKQFSEKENPVIFAQLNFEKLKKCRYFEEFLKDFSKKI